MAGTFDPTPLCDGLNAALYGLQGDWRNAGISAFAMAPYIGDAAKAVKLGRRADESAET